ncbi:MAG: acetate uptake transporter family protein [Dermatophilaceae bacterium]
MTASAVGPRVLTIILVLTVILFGPLGLGALIGSAELALFGGYEGTLNGALAVYQAFAFLINEMFGKGHLPVGQPFRA